MEFLRKLLVQTQSYLKGLSVSQRLAIGSCMALILVALLWLVDWAAKPALVPLLDQTLTAQELTPIQQRLDAQGAQYKVVGNAVLVPAENRAKLLAQLGQSRALPNDISIGFTKVIEESNPFLSMEQQGRLWSLARSNELSRVLREFDGVTDARVFIDEKTHRTIGQSPVTSTASVFVRLLPGTQLDRERVFAMASFVSRAVAGLDISNVAVTDATTGRSYTVPAVADGMANDDLEDRAKKEAYFANQIKSLLANIPGLLVAVHAELDTESRHETKLIHSKPVRLTDKTETTVQERGSPAAGPGTVPNTSRAIANAGTAEKSEKSVTESTYDGKVDVTETRTEAPRHEVKSLSASVNVPRSYMASIYKQSNNNKEPTDAELEAAPTTQTEKDKIQRQVERALNIPKGSNSVVVDVFHDDAMVKLSEVMHAESNDGMLALARTYGGKLGIGALAVVSLFMMLMMVRRASEGPVLPGEEAPVAGMRIKGRRRNDTSPITIGSVAVGEASASEQLLVAKEVDESTIRTQQVVEQVVDLIRDDPDTSVSILQRWIDAEKNEEVAKKGRAQALGDDAPREYNGVTKAAVFLLSVGPETAGAILKHMDRDVVEDITREIASLGPVALESREQIVEEFYNVALAKQYASEGGLNYAKAVLAQALPKDEASRVMQQIEHQVYQQPFSFLQKAESENLLTFMQDEHPQTIALILAHLPSSKGGEILAGLPPAKQIEVVTRVANMEQTNPEVIREVEKGLEQRLSGIVSQQFQKVGGVAAVAEMLNLADRSTEKGILETLEADDPDLVEQIRRLMFVFEDILLVNDKGIQALMKEVDNNELALALKTASPEMKAKIFQNMSERASQLIKEDMEYMGPVRVSDVESAQQRIVDIVRRLEDAGEIIIAGRGGESDIIV